jgi:hypothetical protein
MNKAEYISKISDLQEKHKLETEEMELRHQSEMKSVWREFASSNNPVKVGDIVADSSDRIRVDKIQYLFQAPTIGWDVPSCRYRGYRLRKDGKEFKDCSRGYVYQMNMVEHVTAN